MSEQEDKVKVYRLWIAEFVHYEIRNKHLDFINCKTTVQNGNIPKEKMYLPDGRLTDFGASLLFAKHRQQMLSAFLELKLQCMRQNNPEYFADTYEVFIKDLNEIFTSNPRDLERKYQMKGINDPGTKAEEN